MEVADEFQEVRLLLHHDGLVAVLEEMADPLMAAVEGSRVAREERAHAAREGPLPRPEQEVRVVREQGPCVHGEPGRLDQAPHPGTEIAPIGVVPEDGAALEASHHHVVEDPRSIEARLPGHLNQKLLQNRFRSNVPYFVRSNVPYFVEGSQPNYRTIFQEMRYQSGSGGKRLTWRTPCRGTAIQGATVSFQRR
jgi:hypothetical protein